MLRRLFSLVGPILVLVQLLSVVLIFAADVPLTRSELKKRYGQANTTYNDGKSCDRICNGTAMTCYYEFNVENYDTMSALCGDCENRIISDCFRKGCVTADGFQRNIMSVNRQLPGTPINVCLNDRIVVDVTNHLAGSELSFHWHGLHQKETPWMDGVPMLTQCAIPSGNTFRYKFKASEPGTHYYHAHSGLHRTNGLIGKLNVRHHADPNAALYDYDLSEHSILLSDWNRYSAEEKAPGVRSSTIQADSILINGHGNLFDEKTNQFMYAPMAVFYVERGNRYRWRVDDAASHNCPFELCIANHKLTVIATDGYATEPMVVDCFVISPGERFDFVMHAASDPALNETLLTVRALGNCERRKLQEFARIIFCDDFDNLTRKYEDQEPLAQLMRPDYNAQKANKLTLNRPDMDCKDPRNVCIASLQQKKQDSVAAGNLRHASTEVAKVIPFQFQIHIGEERPSHYLTVRDLALVGTINNIAFSSSSVPPLTQDDSFVSYCNADKLPKHCNSSSVCHCTHMVELDLCKVYEFFLHDNERVGGRVNHPIHLHGFGFQVIDMGTMEQYRTGQTAYANSTALPPIKDTVTVPAGGFARIRFRSCNPGFWFFHCHFEYHMHTGMNGIIKVGNKKDMVPPPSGFPTCGDYFAPVWDDQSNSQTKTITQTSTIVTTS